MNSSDDEAAALPQVESEGEDAVAGSARKGITANEAWEKRGASWSNLPQCRLIIHNVAKKANIGTIVRSAVAMGVSQIIIIGNENFTIIGIEIGDDAKDVTSHPFVGNTAFILGNEGHGLDQKEIEFCDFLVYIPHYWTGTASLNVACAASIVLHHFAVWARYPPLERSGEKYVVDEMRQVARLNLPERALASLERSAARRQERYAAGQAASAASKQAKALRNAQEPQAADSAAATAAAAAAAAAAAGSAQS